MIANLRTTTPQFGSVEAYARRHRRIVPVLGTTIQLSLQQAERTNLSGPLKRLVDGSAFNVEALSTIVPSLRGLIWEFRRSSATAGFELVTVADAIEVALLTAEDPVRRLNSRGA